MKKKFAFFFLFAFFVSSICEAKATPTCKATLWPFSRTQSQKQMFLQMDHLLRETVIEYYFGELTSAKTKKKNVAAQIELYLSQSELNKDRRDFYKFLATGARIDDPKKSFKKLDINEVCDLFAKVESKNSP